MKIQPIVEGHGDVAAFPVLLRCLVAEARSWSIGIGRPIRVPRGKLVQQAGVERASGWRFCNRSVARYSSSSMETETARPSWGRPSKRGRQRTRANCHAGSSSRIGSTRLGFWQPALSARFSLAEAYTNSRSFRKLASSFAYLMRSMGEGIGPWPPVAWTKSPRCK